MTMASILLLCTYAVLSVVCVLLILIPLTTFTLALMASYYRGGSSSTSSSLSFWKGFRTGLYSGRVSHIRFQPVVHSFAYPLFFCCLDLDEIDVLFGNNNKKTRGALWPLNLLMQFHAHDHLKNGEGLLLSSSSQGNHSKQPSDDDDDMSSRIRRLVSERTLGKCQPKGRIFLLTHLTYFGYCFNPVSFYYVLKDNNSNKEEEDEIEAIVAEVSNTPWIEMHCYVLHPHSIDVTDVKPGTTSALLGSTSSNNTIDKEHKTYKSINYIFPKTFHVSPFMSMDHTYDWTFHYQPNTRHLVSTSMLSTTETDASKVKQFNARFDIQRQQFTPLMLCLQLIKLPVYCIIIQIWIHVQAFWLFGKGVEFVSHPEAVETRASRIIASLMTPFFALQACYDGWKEDNHNKKKKNE